MYKITSDIPQPADIGLAHIRGFTGKIVELGQIFAGDAGPREHAFLVTSVGGETVEAVPWRTRFNHVNNYPYDTLYVRMPISDSEAYEVALQARTLVQDEKVRYSFLQYPAIGLHRLHMDNRLLRWYIANTHQMICSQLVDEAFKRSAVSLGKPELNLFRDDRAEGYVIPGSLYRLHERPGVKLFFRERV
jgi:hypothetical protein